MTTQAIARAERISTRVRQTRAKLIKRVAEAAIWWDACLTTDTMLIAQRGLRDAVKLLRKHEKRFGYIHCDGAGVNGVYPVQKRARRRAGKFDGRFS